MTDIGEIAPWVDWAGDLPHMKMLLVLFIKRMSNA